MKKGETEEEEKEERERGMSMDGVEGRRGEEGMIMDGVGGRRGEGRDDYGWSGRKRGGVNRMNGTRQTNMQRTTEVHGV